MTLLTFPPLSGLVYPVGRQPIMSTIVNRAVNNKVNALQMVSYPIYAYALEYSFLRAFSPHAEFQTLSTFFKQVGGRAKAFQFHDVDTDTATAQAFGTGDGVSTDFQLVYSQTAGGFSFAEPVFVPVTVTQITKAGVATALYSIQPGGIIRFNTPPANGAALAWTGTFNWLCRFDDDALDFQKFANNFWRLGKIGMTSEAL